MTDAELKEKAEKEVAKFYLIENQIIEKALEGLNEEEQQKFIVYFLAAFGAVKATLDEREDENEINVYSCIEAMDNAYEMVYKNDQKPEGDS